VAATIPPRSKANSKYTWNAESVFATPEAWEIELNDVLKSIPGVKKFQGRLNESPSVLAEALESIESLLERTGRVFFYAGFSYSVDTTDQNATAMYSKAQGAYGQVGAAISFVNPELIAIGRPMLRQWMIEEPRLAIYEHYVDDLFRKQAHVRSPEVEEVLGMLADPFSGPSNTASMLANADFLFSPAKDSNGTKIEVTQGTLPKILSNPDRKARRTAWESYTDRHLEFKNTLASNLTNSIKQYAFRTQTRRHSSSLAGSLFDYNIPVEVFHNLIDTFKTNLPIWHRYFEIRRKALGVKELHHYDMWAPLAKKKVKVKFEQAVDMISNGLAPMGEDYVSVVRRGCLEERWVDVYPNLGKQTGAFSWGAHGTHPFIMMSYTDEIFSFSTLAHELGHSMHSYLTWKNQPLVYADYSLFVAEVASNFHQAMVRAYLLASNKEKNFQIAVIEEAMANFFRYFFIMPTLARFELKTHERVEKGQALTAESMIVLMADLFEEGYGGKVKVDRQREGIIWATFPHLFSDYYVYAYATGIAGAHALSGRILRGEPNAVEDYLGFLKSGSSLYPLDVLKKAGVDLTSPKPVEEAFATMSGYIDRLEKLLSK
jgi:oligoendopeptidase F